MSDDVNKGGRPPIELTPEQKNNVKALAQYLSKEQIADYLGVSRPTLDAIIARDDEVAQGYRAGKAGAILNVSKGLVAQAMAGNTTAAIFYLKTQAGWKETQGIDHTSGGKEIKSGLAHFYGGYDDASDEGDKEDQEGI